jgi:hypothetical protein
MVNVRVAVAFLPVLSAVLLIALRSPVRCRWIERTTCWIVLASMSAVALLEQPTNWDMADLVAILIAIGALADSIGEPASHHVGQAGGQIRLAAMLFALIPAHPLLTWLALAVASTAGATTRLPRIRAVVSRLIPTNAALGLAVLGLAALRIGSIPLGSLALLGAWGALVALDPVLLPLVLLLCLRLESSVAVAPHPALIGHLMVGVGICAVLVTAVAQLWEASLRRLPMLLVLAQGGIALCAFGLGGPTLRFAGLLHMTLLALSRSAIVLSSEAGIERVAGLASLNGLPPFGLFPSLMLILFGVALQAPWLLLPMLAGLGCFAYSGTTRLPSSFRSSGTMSAWVPLVLALLLGVAMPEPLTAWLQSLTATRP